MLTFFGSVAATPRHGRLIYVYVYVEEIRRASGCEVCFLAVFITLLAPIRLQRLSLATLANNIYTFLI